MERAPLWERDHLLAELRDRLTAAGRGAGALVLLAGEAGAGKTAVVDTFVADVSDRATILSGACDPLTTPRPLSPLLDIASDPASGLPDVARERGEPFAAFEMLLDRLKWANLPTVVVVEDVHWADDATLDFLRFVGRRIEDTHALMLCTYRDDELDRLHPLRVTLGDLAPRESTVALTVEPLSSGAVRGLAAGRHADPERLHRLTGGNPFYVTEVLASGEDVPASIRDAIMARVSRLGKGARRVADAVSIAPRQLEVDHTLELSGADVTDVDEAATSGVLVGVGAALRFRHELARTAVAETLPVAQRLLLHRRMLDLLAADGTADLARLAHHAVLAEEGELVVQYAPAAAREATRQGAHREAAGFYRMALDHRQHLDEETVAQLRIVLADALFVVDEGEALRQRELVVDHYRKAADPSRLGWALVALARSCWVANRHKEHQTAMAEGVRLLDQLGPTAELGQAHYEAGFWSLLSRRRQPTIEHAKASLAIAKQLNRDGVAARSTLLLSQAEVLFGDDAARAVDLGRDAIQQVADLGDRLAAYRGIVHLGWALSEARRYDLAAEELARVVEVEDFDYNVALARALLARIAFEQGEWEDAVEHAEAVIGGVGPGRSPIPAAAAHAALGRTWVRQGDPGGRSALDMAARLSDGASLVDRWFPMCGLAELAWLERRADEIPELLGPLFDEALAADSSWAQGEIGYWMWVADAMDRPPASTAEPYGCQMRGDWHGSAVAWRQLGCPYEEALALADGDAEAQLAAVEILDGLGAGPAAALVRARLRDQGVTAIPRGPRPTTRAHPAGLTDRQADVLALMADGLSNADIADRLFISPKTVEHHVSAIFAKLGVDSRARAIVKANELGN